MDWLLLVKVTHPRCGPELLSTRSSMRGWWGLVSTLPHTQVWAWGRDASQTWQSWVPHHLLWASMPPTRASRVRCTMWQQMRLLCMATLRSCKQLLLVAREESCAMTIPPPCMSSSSTQPWHNLLLQPLFEQLKMKTHSRWHFGGRNLPSLVLVVSLTFPSH